MIDLHTHSTASDGAMTPVELVHHAKAVGLAAIALTDHDGVGGVAEALAEGERIGLEVVPGIELSAQSDTECHIVGLYIDTTERRLLDALDYIRSERRKRNLRYVARLAELGMPVTLDEAMAEAGGDLIGRAHFAKAMVNHGYVASVREAFDEWLASGRPAYMSNELPITAREAIELIHGAGGVAIAAHLHLMKKPDDELYAYIRELRGYGLDGVEGYYSDYTPEMGEKYRAMADELGLAVSGGSDFHGAVKPHIEIGSGCGDLFVPYGVLEGIRARRG